MKKRYLVVFVLLLITVSIFADPPATYDLRDVNGENYVTSVKSQQGGTCWTHGAMAAMEGNLMITGAWTAAGEVGEPDLAEYHLDWWNGFNQFNNDDIDPPTGNGLEVHMGGDYRVTSAYLSRGEGAVRDIDGQSYNTPPARWDPSYHYYYPRQIEWYVAEPDLSNIDLIKYMIMDYGVMGTCLCYDGSFINYQYIHYQPPSSTLDPNHAVAIVGWDDNKDTQAPQPGAWLIKNSWGSGWGLNGYFWISYYDKHCGQHPEMGAISFQDVEPQQYDNIYYHDYHGWRDTKTDCSEAFNKFIGESDELLKAISFFTAVDNVDYTIKIYDDFDGTNLQNELSIKSGTIDYIGLRTIDLDTVVTLSDGEDFYVYLSLSDGGHPYDRTSDVPVLLGAQYRTIVTSSASSEESYYKIGNDWLDFYYYDDPSGFQNTGNFCVKGLAGITGLKVTPNEDFQPEGSIGGPFTPQSKIYELENKGITLFSYEVTNIPTVDWITLSGNTSGALGPGETTEITVEINENANSLGNGAYISTIQFINTTDHIGDTTRDVVLIIGEATLWNEWTFDTDPGWTTEEDWAFGQPTGNGGEHGEPDPTSGYTGNNVYGYNLNGDYPNNLPETHLTSTAIDCSNLYDVHLKFWRWLGVEQPQYDHAYVRVSNDGSNWTTIWENPEEITDDTWTQIDLDISDIADNQETVYLRWTMGETDSGWMYCGWNIDDVQIFAVEGFITHIDNIIENTTKLFGNYPNPFNPSTTISFSVTQTSQLVNLEIYNIKGQKVKTLVNENLPSGKHSVVWNGKDVNNRQTTSGIYFYKLSTGRFEQTRKMILMK